MIKVENIEVFNFEGAIRGLRNPMNSWDKSDSGYSEFIGFYEEHLDCGREFMIGKNDLELMRKLYKAGTEHRKYLRQIFVSMDITAPLYWIAEFDTYKVGITRNSCSFMHKGVSKPFELNDFAKHSDESQPQVWVDVVNELNRLRDVYLETKDPAIFQGIRDLLPSGYYLKYTATMNYENVVNIIQQRTGHRLQEWGDFIKVLKDLPYIREIME